MTFKGPCINIFKWLLAIVVAGFLTLGAAGMIMHDKSIDFSKEDGSVFYGRSVLIPAIAFCLFLFLTSVFVPFKKRNAVIFVLILSFVFVMLGARQHFLDDGYLANKYIIRYTSFLVALATGYMFSYYKYRNNKWTS